MSSNVSLIQTERKTPPSQAVVSDARDLAKGITEPAEFPEGGTTAWCTVIGGVLVQFCGFGYTLSFGVYQDFYTRHYLINESSSAISWIGGINAFLTLAFGLVAGALYDRGYFYHALIGGSLLQSFALFMLSLTKPGQYYQIFLAQGIGLGVAQGLLYVPTLAVVSHYFRRRRTLAMSLVAAGTPLGSIVHPINHGVGFANGVLISAAFVSVLLFIACFLIRTRLEPSKSPANYLSVGRSILHDIPFCIMYIGLFCTNTGFYFPLFYLQLDSIQHRNSETFSFYSLVLLNGGGLLGRLSAGFIATRVGLSGLTIITSAICGIFILGMIGLSSVSTVVALSTVYGYFAGVYVALLPPLMALLTSDLSELGVRMGIASTALGFGGLIGGPISGALLTSQYKWWRPSLFGGLIVLAGSAMLVMMQVALGRRKRLTEHREAF